MAFDFPATPSVGQVYGAYTWDGEKWTGGAGRVATSSSPPSGAVDGDLWWDDDTGLLYIRYDDGTSAQWVQIPGGSVPASPLTNSLAADVALNNTANYFDGPSVAQGSSGTWYASGQVCLQDTTAATYLVKLWDGTTLIASTGINIAAGLITNVSLSGVITSPAGNIRISVRDASTAAGIIKCNASGLGNKDSTITAFRIA